MLEMFVICEVEPTSSPVPTSSSEATSSASATSATYETELAMLHSDLSDVKDYLAFGVGISGIIVGILVFKGLIARMGK